MTIDFEGIYALTDEWTEALVTYDAISMDVTDTESAVGSRLLNLLVGGTSKMSISKSGSAILTDTLTIDQNADAIALEIDSEATTAATLKFTSPQTTTGKIIDCISADALTTGTIAYFESDSADTSSRELMQIVNNNTAATGAVPLRLQQDSTGDILQCFDGSTQVFTVDDEGNVHSQTAATTTLHVETTAVNGIAEIKLENDARSWLIQCDTDDIFKIRDSTGSNDILSVTTTKRVGINTTEPDATLHVMQGSAGSVSPNAFANDFVFEVNGHGGFSFLSPDASVAAFYFGSPSDDKAAFMDWYYSGGRFRIGTHKTGGYVSIYTDNGSEKVRIESTGDVGIQTTNPTAQLHVDQSSGSGAQPVLLLDQADTSEEMIEFVTSIGTGKAIEAVGAKTLTTTHFVKVTLPGSLTRYIPCGTIA